MKQPPHERILLASSSPRRLELLAQIGLVVDTFSPDIDESVSPGENPQDYITRLAIGKAQAADANDRIVLAADTAVILDERIIGKPVDRADAIATLTSLSGRRHSVQTAVAARLGDRVLTVVCNTGVRLRALHEAEIVNYWNTGEPEGKAGSYAIQGLGAIFVERLEGSYSNVVGLPLFETTKLLGQHGYALPGLPGSSRVQCD